MTTMKVGFFYCTTFFSHIYSWCSLRYKRPCVAHQHSGFAGDTHHLMWHLWRPAATTCSLLSTCTSSSNGDTLSLKLRTMLRSSSRLSVPLNLNSLIVFYAHWLLCANESMTPSSEKLLSWYMLKVISVLYLYSSSPVCIKQILYR